MNEYIVTFGFNGNDGYTVLVSKPIPAKTDTDASIKLKEQFEMYEGVECTIISVTKI